MHRHRSSAALRTGLVLAVIVIVIDQLSKWWILALFAERPPPVVVTGFFNLVLAWNRGVSFGLLSSGSAWAPWLLSGFGLLVVAALIWWLATSPGRWAAVAIGLIIGGALGNIVDRLRFGAVVDFLDFYVGSYHWHTFNVADSAISIGVATLLIEGFFGRSAAADKAPE